MKPNQLIGMATLLLSISMADAQVRVNDPKRTTERQVEGRVNSRIDQGINRGLDKVEQGIGNIFKKKDKPNKNEKPQDGAAGANESSDLEPEQTDASKPATRESGPSGAGRADEPVSLKSYSKYDFVPGEKVVAYEDFNQDAIGDFPDKWNTNASGEVVTIEGKPGKWLKITQNGTFYPEFLGDLPENMTIEMDLATSENVSSNYQGLGFVFAQKSDKQLQYDQANLVEVFLHPGNTSHSGFRSMDKDRSERVANKFKQTWSNNAPYARIAFWRQKSRLRLYVNGNKVMDIPRAFDPAVTYRFLMSRSYWCDDCSVYLTNLRMAVGAPDTRSKLLTEGKLVTRGILFDVNSDKIKPESFGTLKDIATVLTENAEVRVKIVGHTDSDGDDVSNLALSKKRAAAVKTALGNEFGINADRMETDGMGESKPSEPTLARRVKPITVGLNF